ncbi:MAG: hypothetical protein JW751_16195 [Polyangiaceae bacterium]|nr:hypothetical protein [Polyangiaceae bacterium]
MASTSFWRVFTITEILRRSLERIRVGSAIEERGRALRDRDLVAREHQLVAR